jgi:competence protein ComK
MENYEINEETYVVMSEHIGKTKIFEKDGEYSINHDAYKVMDESCQYYGSSYKGRLKAAKNILDCSYKLPILVEESSCLIFFPIKSSLLDDCCWINVNSIKKVEKYGKGSKITLKNDTELIFDVSKLSIDNQIYRSIKLESIIKKRINAKKEA